MSGRTGLLGGTFDPVHRGHVEAALRVRRILGLDRVVLLPSRVPPHRHVQPLASAFHRFAMASLAVQDQAGLEVSDLELRLDGPSYTARTLAALAATGFSPWQLFFITGADAFADIATWREYPALLDAAHFVVVSRPGHDPEGVRGRAPAVVPRIVDLRGVEAEPARPLPETPSVILVDGRTPDVSSTEVRRLLAAGRSIAHLVPPAVCQHIARHRLYAPPDGGNPLA
jgi:nicotinate-nucleotide adenylyltransferase